MTPRGIANRIRKQEYKESAEIFFQSYNLDTVKVPLTRGLYTVISKEDYPAISNYLWRVTPVCAGR